jgi:hypothetical protein
VGQELVHFLKAREWQVEVASMLYLGFKLGLNIFAKILQGHGKSVIAALLGRLMYEMEDEKTLVLIATCNGHLLSTFQHKYRDLKITAFPDITFGKVQSCTYDDLYTLK